MMEFANIHSMYAHKSILSKLILRQFAKSGTPQKQNSTTQFFPFKAKFQNEFKVDQRLKAPSAKT